MFSSVGLNGAGLIGIGISDTFVCADDAGAYAVVEWGRCYEWEFESWVEE